MSPFRPAETATALLEAAAALSEAAAAAAAERDASPFVGRHILGPARLDPDGSSPLRWQVVADTGSRAIDDGPLERLILVDLVGQDRVRARRLRWWEGRELLLEGTDETPAGLTGTSAEPGGASWYLVTEGGPSQLPTARAEALAALAADGPDTTPLVALLGNPPQATPDGPLRVRPGRGPAAVAGSLVELLAAGGRVLVVSDPVAADRVTELLLDVMADLAPGRLLRIGVTSRRALADDPRVSVDAALDQLAPTERAELDALEAAARVGHGEPTVGPDHIGPSGRTGATGPPGEPALAMARAILAEAGALRVAAEVDAAAAAEADARAAEELRRLRVDGDGYRRLDELAARIERMVAAGVVAARETGGLATLARSATAPDATRTTERLAAAADTTVQTLRQRDAPLDDLARQERALQASGVTRRQVRDAERAARQARTAYADADATRRRAVVEERRAAAELAALVRRTGSPSGPDPSPGSSEHSDTAALRIRHRAATSRRAAHLGRVLERAAIVVTSPEELVLDPELASLRAEHVLVDGAAGLPLTTLCLLAARATLTMTVLVDAADRPAPPSCTDPHRRRWLATPITELITPPAP